jgi:cytochrome c oxidase subunit III
MATSTKSLPKTGMRGGPKPGRPNGNGSPNGNGHALTPGFSASRYRIGMWVAMAAILMMFSALSSAYIVRAASSNDWRSLAVPPTLWVSTVLILVSSVSLEIARRKLKTNRTNSTRLWFWISAALGIGFLASQILAWRSLVRQGIYVATNPHSSFFYLLTATHAVHLFGGLLALLYLAMRKQPRAGDDLAMAKSRAAADVTTLYWHFMDVLWIYVFFLLFFWK